MFLAICVAASLQQVAVASPAPVAPVPVAAIAADRPGFTTGPIVLARGKRQIETGASHIRAGDSRQTNVGEILFRAGLTSRAELRIALNSYDILTAPGARATGIEDASIGTKIRVVSPGESAWRPLASLILSTSVATGSASFGNSGPEPVAVGTAAWSLPASTTLGVNLGVANRVDGAGDRAFESLGGASIAFPLVGAVGSYLEYSFANSGGATSGYLNTGLAFTPTPNSQLDLWVARPTSSSSTGFSIGLGLARRW